MNVDRWQQVAEIFHAALARDAAARDAFLRDACQGDPFLRNEVDALIAAHGDAGSSAQTRSSPRAPRVSRRARDSGLTTLKTCSASVAWARSIARTTPSWAAVAIRSCPLPGCRIRIGCAPR